MSDRFETFYYFSDVKLPEKITRLIKEARKECQEQGYVFPMKQHLEKISPAPETKDLVTRE